MNAIQVAIYARVSSERPTEGQTIASQVAALRERVMADADAGLSSKDLAARYHVSRPWVDALKQRRRETGSIAPRKQTKFRRRVLEGQEDRLKALVTAQPDATLAELRDALRTSAASSSNVSPSALHAASNAARFSGVM